MANPHPFYAPIKVLRYILSYNEDALHDLDHAMPPILEDDFGLLSVWLKHFVIRMYVRFGGHVPQWVHDQLKDMTGLSDDNYAMIKEAIRLFNVHMVAPDRETRLVNRAINKRLIRNLTNWEFQINDMKREGCAYLIQHFKIFTRDVIAAADAGMPFDIYRRLPDARDYANIVPEINSSQLVGYGGVCPVCREDFYGEHDSEEEENRLLLSATAEALELHPMWEDKVPHILPCGHIFCIGCIRGQLKTLHNLCCPMCRAEFPVRPLSQLERQRRRDLHAFISRDLRYFLTGQPLFPENPENKLQSELEIYAKSMIFDFRTFMYIAANRRGDLAFVTCNDGVHFYKEMKIWLRNHDGRKIPPHIRGGLLLQSPPSAIWLGSNLGPNGDQRQWEEYVGEVIVAWLGYYSTVLPLQSHTVWRASEQDWAALGRYPDPQNPKLLPLWGPRL